MRGLLLGLLELGIQYTDTLVGEGFVYMSAVTAVVVEFRIIRGAEPDIIHVVALFAEFHFSLL
jgi:hypothetical protein